MAHYYHVLSQDDKSNDKVAQFYPNLEENQTVQFVIASDGSQQQFQAQPVVVSSDQLMVVEGQGQQVIIDQSQVTYQSPPYVVQETSGIEFPNNQQQVYYMTNTSPNQSVVVEQSINQQPVVLNHQFLQNQMSKANSPMHQTGVVNASVIQEKSIVQMRNQIKAAAKHNIVNKALQLTPQKMVAKDIAQNLQSSLNDNEADNNEEETVTLRDERMINYTQYRRLITQKQNQAMQERLASQNIASFQRKPRPAINKQLPRNARPKQPIRLNRNNVAFIPNASLEERYEEHKSPIKQNTSQFQNQMPQRQQPQMNRPSQVQESQNQYLIQPRQRDSKPQIQRPLPQFLHTSQIQNIIDNAPKSAEYSDSIRMLVLLDNGEQRLITFTLPKEACTIQEILEQVGVPFTKETPIQVTEANSNGLNYIVAVGNVPGFTLEPPEEITLENEFGQQQVLQVIEQEPPPLVEVSTKPPSPEPPKELPPKIIEGLLAVCQNCGYLSEDFNKCMRCKRKLPENVKSVAAVNSNGKKVDPRSGLVEKRLALQKTNGIPRMNLLPKKRPSKPKLLECETVVVSSDEEESDKKTPVKNVSEQLLEKLGASVTISPISKEPSTVDIQKSSMTVKGTEKVPFEQVNSTLLLCRTIRIGSYRFVPPEPIRVDSNGITLKVPHPKIENTLKIIKIESSDIVKVLISFQKSLPVLFYYLLPSVGAVVREALDMTPVSDYYFDPLSEIEEAHRRITLLPESLSEESKITLQKIYSKNSLLDELTYKEANDILIKTCPKELSKTVMSYSVSEIKALLMYPAEGRGRITINTEDYMCLGQDQFLNDVIIDFYLKYLLLNLPKERQDKVHIFSTFFYKRLTTKPLKASRKSQPTEIDPNLSPAQKRHSRVKTWTKNVNIFEKDFIIVPINENCHWFLAIICFPNMNGTHTMDGQPIRIEPKQSQKKKKVVTAAVKEKNIDPSIMCEDGDSSDKDEAEGDDSELDSDDSEESPPQTLSVENNSERPPIKQPCILIFDSLAGASRSRVVATLRDYLTCEYKAKLNEEKIFTKDIIKGACPKVPQQTNFTDCGLYLLQYVEQFFNDPIKDYHIPILHLKTWFEEITVTKKREDISLLIQSLMKEAGKDLDILPDVIFPTQNGELTERALMEKEDKFMDDEMMEDEDEDYVPPMGKITSDQSDETGESNSESQGNFALKPSNEGVVNSEFTEQAVTSASLLKPDISDLPKQSSKDTLSYLKAKRIIRHKNNMNSDGAPDSKKAKSETSDT